MHLYILPEALANGQPNGIANVAVGTDPAIAIRESGGNAAICSNATDNVYCWAEHDSLTIFAQQVTAMRTWMKQHGQQNKPLLLSEYSILYPYEVDNSTNPPTCYLTDEYGQCFTPSRVINYMKQTSSYLENAKDSNLGYPLDDNRLVQQWLWFSTYTAGVGSSSNLLSRTLTSLTSVGQEFSKAVNSLSTNVNLLPARVDNLVVSTLLPTDTASVTLSADIINNGNTGSTTPFTLTFYSDQDLTRVIGSKMITQSLGGCVHQTATVTTTWGNLSSGANRYWIQIEGDAPYTADNIASGMVLVNPTQVFLPIVLR
jgi:hypothetical protein